jgi:hypothetical protein
MKKCVNISLSRWDVMFIHCMCNAHITSSSSLQRVLNNHELALF